VPVPAASNINRRQKYGIRNLIIRSSIRTNYHLDDEHLGT